MTIADKIGQLRAERKGVAVAPRVRERVHLAGGDEKAISHRPDLMYRVHMVSQTGDSVQADLDEYADYATVYQVYTWVHKAVSKIAEAIAPLPVRVVDGDGEAVDGHPITELLGYVNDRLSPADLWQAWTVHMLLGGESFFEYVDGRGGMPVEIWPRRPDHVRVLPDMSRERLMYPTVAGYLYGENEAEMTPIEPESMSHERLYNPLSTWRGLAPMTAVREGVTIDLFAQAWPKKFFKQGARPDYAVIAPQGITRSERDQIEEDLMFKFSGADNWHKPVVLEDGVTDVKPLSFPPKDLEWLQQREFARDEVAALFGVPDEIMGFGRDTYENFQTALQVFWSLTLVPLCGHRDTSLTHFFSKVRPLLAPGQQVATDLTGVGVLQEDLTPKLEQGSKMWSMGVPFNTIDERLGLGVGPIPGGEVGYLPFSVMPVGEERNTEPPPFAPAEEDSDEPELEPEPETDADNEDTRAPQGMVTKAGPEFGSPEHVARWKAFERQRVPHERRMVRQLKRDFQRQQGIALGALRESFGKAWAKAVKAAVLPDAGELVNWPEEVKLFFETYRPYFDDVVTEFGEAQLAELGVGIAFDITNPLVAEAVREMLIKFADDINKTTQQRMATELREILVEAEEEGLGIPQIQERIYDRISSVFNVRKSDYETERIARTEMVKASNQGALDGMRQSGVVQRKGWLAALDGRQRETHERAHMDYSEQGIPLEEPFKVGADSMDAPGQGRLPEENINCRCSVIAILGPAPTG